MLALSLWYIFVYCIYSPFFIRSKYFDKYMTFIEYIWLIVSAEEREIS